jgi:hypothetical protein
VSAAELRPVRSTWFIVVLSAMMLACASTPEHGGSTGDTTNAVVSRTKAVVNQSFSSTVTVYSNYVTVVEFSPSLEGTLPPGIYWYPERGEFSGTPTQTGFYSVKMLYRDVAKGHKSHPNLADNMWYYRYIEFEVSRFEQPEVDGTCSVTFENTASWKTRVFVDDVEVATLQPGESRALNIRAGTRALRYDNSDGSLGVEEIRRFEYGSNYTVTLRAQ